MIIEIADLDLKLKTLTDCLKIGQNVRWSQNCNEIFVRSDTQNKSNILLRIKCLELLILTQNYRFGQICSYFHETWHSQQTEHANYQCNTRQSLKRSRDYWLKMSIGSG